MFEAKLVEETILPEAAQIEETVIPVEETVAPAAATVVVAETATTEEEVRAESRAMRRRSRTRRQAVTAEDEARFEESIQPEEAVQVERLLAVIQRYPAGVSIVEIGNGLGVDWRSLIATLQSLEEERKIERINTMYYPREKAGEGEL